MGWLTGFLAAVAFLVIGVIFSPETFASKSDGLDSPLLTLLKLVHLLSFSTAWGVSLWLTFVGGVIVYKYLPLHQLGNLHIETFPVYFSLLAVCCAISAGSFGYLHPWKSSSASEKYQLCVLLSVCALNLTNRLVFIPVTNEMIKQRHELEREHNIGNEIGKPKNKQVGKVNSKLAAVNKKYGLIHGVSSLANFVSFGILAMHSWYLVGKMNL